MSVQSYLSMYGDELAMLEDMVVAVEWLTTVSIRLVERRAPGEPSLQSQASEEAKQTQEPPDPEAPQEPEASAGEAKEPQEPQEVSPMGPNDAGMTPESPSGGSVEETSAATLEDVDLGRSVDEGADAEAREGSRIPSLVSQLSSGSFSFKENDADKFGGTHGVWVRRYQEDPEVSAPSLLFLPFPYPGHFCWYPH